MKTNTSEAPEFGQLEDGIYPGSIIKIHVSESAAKLMRSEGKPVDFLQMLKSFDIVYASIGILGLHGILIFLQDMQFTVTTKPEIKNKETGDLYTTIIVRGKENKKLFTLRFDPNKKHSKYSVVKN